MLAVVFASLFLSCAAFVPGAPPSHAPAHAPLLRTSSASVLMQQRRGAPKKKKDDGPPPFSGFGSAEEERRQKLEVGTNWPPRTSTVAGEGYQFFQGPTPKTGVQEGMPGFFEGVGEGLSEANTGAFVAIGAAAVGSAALFTFLASA